MDDVDSQSLRFTEQTARRGIVFILFSQFSQVNCFLKILNFKRYLLV